MLTDWDSIVRQHSAIVLNAAYRVLGNRADAEDVAQQVFLEAFAKRLRPDSSWGALLKGVAVSRAIDLLRRRSQAGSLDGKDLPDLRSRMPDQAMLLKEEEAVLRHAITRLAARDAEVFCLRCFEGLGNEEVAELLSISPPAVAAALSRAKSKLRSLITPKSCEVPNV